MIRLHNQNRTHTFIDVESGSFISLPKDGTDKPPVNADINNNIDAFHSTGGGGTPSEPIPFVNVSEYDKTVCGKNLAKIVDGVFDIFTISEQTISFSKVGGSAERALRLNDGAVATSWDGFKSLYQNSGFYLPPNTYTLSVFDLQGYTSNILYPSLNVFFADGTRINKSPFNNDTKIKFTTVKPITAIVLYAASGEFTNVSLKIKLEIGDISNPVWEAYTGNNYPYLLEDTDGILHYGGDLPDGTADSVNWETGEFVERVKKIIFTSGAGWRYNSDSSYPELARVHYNDTNNGWGEGINRTTANLRCNIGGTSGWSLYSAIVQQRRNDTLLHFVVTKSELGVVGGETTEQLNALAAAWVDNQIALHGNIEFQYELATPQIYQIKQYGETYGGVVWEYNEKPKSIQYHTNIFTDKNIDMQCEVRKLGNRKMSEFYWVTETGDRLITEDGDYIMLEY